MKAVVGGGRDDKRKGDIGTTGVLDGFEYTNDVVLAGETEAERGLYD
jgi:hypothetical protein